MSGRLYIVDTNVLVAGMITAQPDAPPSRVLDAMLDGSLLYLLSADLLREYRNEMLRPKLSRRHGLNEHQIDQVLSEITANAVWREIQPDNAATLGHLSGKLGGIFFVGDPVTKVSFPLAAAKPRCGAAKTTAFAAPIVFTLNKKND